ncbi:macrocin-O-methyltransferase domain-containing protein [Nostoc sp. NIES-4103]|nr:macrocin-O-methyltransferase domain-containing protein [Nostoc sp. NIES-4103]
MCKITIYQVYVQYLGYNILNMFYDSILPNGIILMDDYGYWEGRQKALHKLEYLRGEQFNHYQIG